MTTVEVWLIDSKIKRLKVTGHANSDEYGKDIVCASISTSVILTSDIITKLSPSNIVYSDEANALIDIQINEFNDEVNVVMNSLYELLNELKSQYPRNLKIVLK